MVEFDGFGHINIIIDDLEKAAEYYVGLLGAEKVQEFPHFKNVGFSRSAGFLEKPEDVDVSICFLEIPNAGLFIELFEYHSPPGDQAIHFHKTNDMGGPRHICLRVKEIDKAFDHVKSYEGVRLINPSAEYQPFKIDHITPDQFKFADPELESNLGEKQKVCETVGRTRYFYFIDGYGVQWEFEQGHEDIGG